MRLWIFFFDRLGNALPFTGKAPDISHDGKFFLMNIQNFFSKFLTIRAYPEVRRDIVASNHTWHTICVWMA